jgi:eukaryotic-like serine/threonine-protein kinase
VLRLIKYFLLGLVLLFVCLASALLAMRFAIHGREVRVPKFVGMSPVEAERLANSEGLVLSIDNRFYSTDVPEGYIISQLPAPNSKVRRGWKVRVAQSLGQQRASIPNVVGESERVAELNISRRGLEIGTVATIHFPGAQPATVIAQSPPADARNALSPKIGLIMSAADNAQAYIMPNFVGRSLPEAAETVKQAGFTLGKVDFVGESGGTSEIIVRQFPAAGQKIAAGTTISLVVGKQ